MEVVLEGDVIQQNARAVSQQKGKAGQENIGDAEKQADFAMVASKHVRCQNTTNQKREQMTFSPRVSVVFPVN